PAALLRAYGMRPSGCRGSNSFDEITPAHLTIPVRLRATPVREGYQINATMSALGHKQTCAAHKLMSALTPESDIKCNMVECPLAQKRTWRLILESRQRAQGPRTAR